MLATDAQRTALTARGLRKVFGPKVAVDRVDIDVAPGSFFGIVGPIGAGKTTTLRMATGLLRPDAGQVWVEGIDVWADPVAAKKSIGVLPEDLALFERLSGRELLMFHGALRNLDPKVVDERSEELLELLGLTEAADTLVVDYSHGMRKKIALAAGVPCNTVAMKGDLPYDGIIKEAKRAKCDLIMMASHGHKGLKDMMFGTTINAVRHRLRVPILVVREKA